MFYSSHESELLVFRPGSLKETCKHTFHVELGNSQNQTVQKIVQWKNYYVFFMKEKQEGEPQSQSLMMFLKRTLSKKKKKKSSNMRRVPTRAVFESKVAIGREVYNRAMVIAM